MTRRVLILNPQSGGGKASRYGLLDHCRRRGIEPIVFERGQDLSSVATEAVIKGADVIGMAGGDGSQGAVAAVASEHDVPYVCVPAGTRNHFALDLGVDRHDIVAALDAFFARSERRIDLARVNGRVFVNNASMGLYAEIVQSPEYRDAKLRTVLDLLPELVGPTARPFDLRFRGPDGGLHRDPDVLVVSNNRYEFDLRSSPETRRGIDQGVLGVVVVPKGPSLQGWSEWTTPTLMVDSDAAVDVGLDGEAASLEPPLVFESLPSALRIRCPASRRRQLRWRLPRTRG